MAAEMGIELLTEEEYLSLQKLGEFDASARAGWQPRQTFVKRAARFGVAAVLVASSLDATARSLTTPPGAFVAR